MCNSCYKGDRVYNIIIRYASTNSGTQISLCCDCLKKLNDAIGETLWKEDGARITETHEKREETHACDLISRQAAVEALGEEPEVWTDDDDYALGQRNQWQYDVTALKAVKSAQPERKVFEEMSDIAPSAQPERLTDDDFETIRILLNADKEKLCNQRRWKEAEEYQRIIDRFMTFASAQPAEADVQKMQGLEQAEIQKAYELGKLDAMEEMPHWIPCSERMPKEKDAGILKKIGKNRRSDYVLATVEVKGERMTVTSCTQDGVWDWNMKYAFPDYKVVAWMPLPKPYVDGKDNSHDQ